MSTLRELKDMIEKLEKTYEDPDTQVVFSTTLYPIDNNDVYLADYCGRSFTQECGDKKDIDCYFADMWEDVAFLIGCTSNRERIARALDMHEDCVYVDSEHCFVILNLFQEKTIRESENNEKEI